MKALPTPAILRILKEEGCGVDCASTAELMLAKACGFEGEDIMFSANDVPPEEFKLAREMNAFINLDDITHVETLNENGGIPEEICLRYNPGSYFSIAGAIMGEPEEIIPMNMSTGFDGVTAEDYGFCVLKYKNGISFAKTCAFEVGGFLRRQLVVAGSKGTYEIRPWELHGEGGQRSPASFSPLTDKVSAWGTDVSEKLDFPPCDRYDNMMKAFAEIVRGAENPYTPDYELKLFKLVMKCCGYSE